MKYAMITNNQKSCFYSSLIGSQYEEGIHSNIFYVHILNDITNWRNVSQA